MQLQPITIDCPYFNWVVTMKIDPTIEAIVKRREISGITQDEMATAIGLSPQTYRRIEKGSSSIRLFHYRGILRELKTTDLDIYLDTLGVDSVVSEDVAAAARLLDPGGQVAMVKMLLSVHKTLLDGLALKPAT